MHIVFDEHGCHLIVLLEKIFAWNVLKRQLPANSVAHKER